MTTAKLFTLGNSQAVRIPARYRISADEVEVFERDGELVLRPKLKSAAHLFERIRSKGGDFAELRRPDQGKARPAPSFE